MNVEKQLVEAYGHLTTIMMAIQKDQGRRIEEQGRRLEAQERKLLELERRAADLGILDDEDDEVKTADEIKELAGFKGRAWGSVGELFRDIRDILYTSRAYVSRSIAVPETTLRRYEAGRTIHHQGDVFNNYQSLLRIVLDDRISECEEAISVGEESGHVDSLDTKHLAQLGALSTMVSHPVAFMPKIEWDDEEAM